MQGVNTNLPGPTLLDLRESLGYTYDEISTGIAMRLAGMAIGAILGGVLHDMYSRHSDIITATSMVISAIANIFIPLSPSLPLFGFLFVLSGQVTGVIQTGE